MKAGTYNESKKENEHNNKVNEKYLTKGGGAALIPGLDLLAHIQPQETNSGRHRLVIDAKNATITQYASKNFSANEAFGYTMLPFPDNEYLLTSYGYAISANVYDYIQFTMKNMFPILSGQLAKVSKIVKCWESSVDFTELLKQKYVNFDIRLDVYPNERLMNFIR